jgi:hypothetical protein
MKHTLQKSENLSLVLTDARASETAREEKAAKLRDSFDGWLNSVAPSLEQSTSTPDQRDGVDRPRRRSLTLTEVMRVNFATVREGIEHRHWPPEVVLGFLAAEVIKRKQS